MWLLSVLSRMYVTGRNFVGADDGVHRGFFCLPSSRWVFFVGGLRLSLTFSGRLTQVHLGLWVRSGGGLWSSRDIRATFPGFLQGYGSWGITDVAPCCWERHPLQYYFFSESFSEYNSHLFNFVSARVADSLGWYSYASLEWSLANRVSP